MTAPNSPGDLPHISAPAHRALAGAGIGNLRDLTRFTRKQIADLHGMGPKGLRILDEALREAGLEFAPETDA